NVGPLVPALHVEVLRIRGVRAGAFRPLRPRGVIQASGLVRGAADVPRADDAVPVRDSKVKQAPRIDVIVLYDTRRYGVDELVAKLDGPQHRLPQHRRSEAPLGCGAGVVSHSFQRVKEQRKRPLAVRTARDAEVPLVTEVL